MKRILKRLCNKKESIKYIKLKTPDGSIGFFEDLKLKSEKEWKETSIDKNLYGFQIQQNTKWNKGLNDSEIEEFESKLGLKFPECLKNFYRVMNGVDLPSVNVYGNSNIEKSYSYDFYSYPRDLEKIKEMINWIYDTNNTSNEELLNQNASRIFPIYSHRFMLIDIKENTILSMYGADVIFWEDNISKLLGASIFSNIENVWEFESNPNHCPKINFWIN